MALLLLSVRNHRDVVCKWPHVLAWDAEDLEKANLNPVPERAGQRPGDIEMKKVGKNEYMRGDINVGLDGDLRTAKME